MGFPISTLGGLHIGVAIVLFVFASIAVSLRFVCRARMRQKPFLDDWLILASLIVAIALVVEVCLWGTRGGFGFPLRTLAPTQVKEFFHILFAQRITYWLMSPLTKTSILLLYRRLFSVNPLFHRLTLLVGLLVIASSLIGTSLFVYHYLDARAHHLTLSAILSNESLLRFVLGSASASVALDFIILVLPLPLIWSLQMSPGKKWSVSVVFLLGSLTVVASAMRLLFIYGLKYRSYEYALDGPSCIWSTVEALLSIISACLPTLRPLFVRPGLGLRRGSGREGENGDGAGAGAGVGRFEGQAEMDERLRRRLELGSTLMDDTQVHAEQDRDQSQSQEQSQNEQLRPQILAEKSQARTESDASEPTTLGQSEASWKDVVGEGEGEGD